MEALVPLLIYLGIGVVVILLGILFFLRAFASRKTYRCPQCGEEIRVELMHASHCNTCGADLEMTERRHVEP